MHVYLERTNRDACLLVELTICCSDPTSEYVWLSGSIAVPCRRTSAHPQIDRHLSCQSRIAFLPQGDFPAPPQPPQQRANVPPPSSSLHRNGQPPAAPINPTRHAHVLRQHLLGFARRRLCCSWLLAKHILLLMTSFATVHPKILVTPADHTFEYNNLPRNHGPGARVRFCPYYLFFGGGASGDGLQH